MENNNNCHAVMQSTLHFLCIVQNVCYTQRLWLAKLSQWCGVSGVGDSGVGVSGAGVSGVVWGHTNSKRR